jgi:Sec-independent protein translocase protein TatA
MFNLDPSKLLVIVVVMIIVLGPDRLPHFARQFGSAWRFLSEFRQRLESEVRGSFPDLPSTTELANYARSPAALLNRFASSTSVDESTAYNVGAMADLPPIGRGDQAYWTTISSEAARSQDSPRPNCVSGTDAERVWIGPPVPFVGDGNVN